MSCPYTPQQSEKVERRHRTIIGMALSQPFHRKDPLKFWVESVITVVFLIN